MTLLLQQLIACALQPVTAKEWIKVAVPGEWKGYPRPDGTFGFALTDKDLQDMVRNFGRDRRGRIVVDYEHQTLMSAKNGQPAPAAGWITALEVRQGDGGPELHGRVGWTQSAATAIEANEYGFVSPVIVFHAKNKATKEDIGTWLHSVALTNHPFLDELPAVAATETYSMRNLLLLLLPLLALSDAASEEEAVKAVGDLADGKKAVCKALGLPETASMVDIQAGWKKTEVALKVGQVALQTLKLSDGVSAEQALAALKPALDHAGYVAASEHTRVLEELGRIKADGLVKAAMAEGKVIPATEPWARDFAANNPGAFMAWCAVAPKVFPGPAPERKTGDNHVSLSDTEQAITTQLGLTPEEFNKGR